LIVLDHFIPVLGARGGYFDNYWFGFQHKHAIS